MEEFRRKKCQCTFQVLWAWVETISISRHFWKELLPFHFQILKKSSPVGCNSYSTYCFQKDWFLYKSNNFESRVLLWLQKAATQKKVFCKPAIPVFLFPIKTCLVFNTALYRLVLNCYNYTSEYGYNGNRAIRDKEFSKIL